MPDTVTARPGIRFLLKRLAANTARWAEAEMELAHLESHVLLRRCIAGAIFALLGFAAVLIALVIFALTAVAALAPLLESEVLAGLVVGAAILALATLCAWGLRRMFTWEAESLPFRWLAPPDKKRAPKWTS